MSTLPVQRDNSPNHKIVGVGGDYDDDVGVGVDVGAVDDGGGGYSNLSKSAHYCRASFSETGPSCRPPVGYTTQSTFC